jgi:hypothetical protein
MAWRRDDATATQVDLHGTTGALTAIDSIAAQPERAVSPRFSITGPQTNVANTGAAKKPRLDGREGQHDG